MNNLDENSFIANDGQIENTNGNSGPVGFSTVFQSSVLSLSVDHICHFSD